MQVTRGLFLASQLNMHSNHRQHDSCLVVVAEVRKSMDPCEIDVRVVSMKSTTGSCDSLRALETPHQGRYQLDAICVTEI